MRHTLCTNDLAIFVLRHSRAGGNPELRCTRMYDIALDSRLRGNDELEYIQDRQVYSA